MSEKRQSFIALTLLYVILLGAAGALTTDIDGNFHFAKLRLITTCFASLCIALPLAWIAMRHTIARIIISTVLWILLFIELFVFCHFGSRISFQVLDLVRHTNPDEASEFFSTYMFSISTCIVFLVCAGIAAVWYLIRRSLRHIPVQFVSRSRRYTAYAVITILSAVTLACALFTSRFYYQLTLPTIPQYIAAMSSLSNLGDIQEQIERRLPMAEALMTDSVQQPAIVYVIGESFSRLHSQLYGYAKPTNPILSRELKAGHLLVFDSVVTPSASTAHVMYNIFFTHTTMDTVPWYHTQLLPVLMHNAGYRVTLHDNQATRLLGDDVKGGDLFFFLNTHRIEPAAFDYRNSELQHYDMDFLDAEADSINICPGSLTMIHLCGQHIPAENRYPAEFGVFSADDYAYRSDLDDSQRLEVAHYDNATIYNDSVIGRIISFVQGKDAIVIYHTDHGEEIHDYRNHYGRTLEPVTPQIYNCIYHIPMAIYTTPEFRNNHADLYQRLEHAAHRPFNITHIPHLIITIGGVTTPWYRPQANPLSPLYDQDSARFGASG